MWDGMSRSEEHADDELTTAVLSAIDAGVIVLDDEGAIQRANETVRNKLGLSEANIGVSASEALPLGEYLTQLSPGESLSETTLAPAPQPAEVDAEPAVRSHTDGVELIVPQGDIKRCFVVKATSLSTAAADRLLLFEEVSAQRRIESQFKTAMGYTSDTVVVVRSDGTVRYVSDPPETTTKSPSEISVSKNLLKIVHPDDRSTLETALEIADETGDASIHHCRLETDNNGWRMFEVSVRENRSLPAVDGLIVTARDVTDRHQFEQRRQVMNRILRHDLRNDMNVVVGHADMLLQSDDDQVTTHAETIRQKALSLVNLGDKVRTIDQQLHGVDRQLRQINIAQIVREEISTIHDEYPSVIIRSRIDETTIIGNTLIRTAVRNVLDNSIVHNDNSCPEIEVEVDRRHETNRVQVEIRDNGPGIPEGERRAITNEAETPLEHISGLGLWLVKWIVDGMDGSLSISQNSPRGTVVTLSFPAADADKWDEIEDQRPAGVADGIPFASGSMGDTDPIGTTTRSEE
jgi:PAS domain S-box-containing protein